MKCLHLLGVNLCLLIAVGYSANALSSTNKFYTAFNANEFADSPIASALAKRKPSSSGSAIAVRAGLPQSVGASLVKDIASTEIAKSPDGDFICPNATNQRQINECMQQKAGDADKKLNQTYQKLIATLRGEERRKLVNAQLAWIKFRDTSCAYEYERWHDGTIAPTIYSGCLQRLTEQRTTDLENYLRPGWPLAGEQ